MQSHYSVNPAGEGERESPYAEGFFTVAFELTGRYPTDPPKVVHMINLKIWH